MNEVINNILARKGTKEYRPDPVGKDKLELIMRCAAAAPNAFNAQEWHFTCITNRVMLEELEEKCYKALVKCGTCSANEPYVPFYHAPAVIICSADRENEFKKQDCSAALENAALAAKSLGLGSRFLDVPNEYFHSPESKSTAGLCGIPENYETVCFLSVGYPKDAAEQPATKRSDVFTYVDE